MSVSAVQSLVPGSQPLLVYENFARAELGATAVASSTAASGADPFNDLAVDNILYDELDRTWRSGSIAALPPAAGGVVSVTIYLGDTRLVDWVSIHRHNVRVPWMVELFRDDPASGAPAVNVPAWTDPIVRAALTDFTFSTLLFGLGPRESSLRRLASLFRLDSFVCLPSVLYGIQYARLSFDVSAGSNAGVDYLQLAYPIVGRLFQSDVGATLEWEVYPIDRSATVRTSSGAKRGRKLARGRGYNFTLGYLDRTLAFRRLLSDFTVPAGNLGLVFTWPEPQQRGYFYDAAILGQVEGLPKFAMAFIDTPAARGFSIEEAE